MKPLHAAQLLHHVPAAQCCLSCVPHPNLSIYNINKQLLSSSQLCGGVYICVGHLSSSSQWAFTLGKAPGREQPQLETGTESVLGKILYLPKSSCVLLDACPSSQRSSSEVWGSLISWNIPIYWPLKKRGNFIMDYSVFLRTFFIIKNIWKVF